MMSRFVFLSLLFLIFFTSSGLEAAGQDRPHASGKVPGLDYYLPQNISYNPAIPTPESVLGFQVGEWHVRHGLIVEYMHAVAAASDRVHIEEYGRTHERRPLLLLTISSPDNLSNIDEIRERHRLLANPQRSVDLNLEEMPVVTWLGYSVHGNESSGANASLLTVFYLAAAEGAAIDELLDHSVILVDPVYNPDGLDRFAGWVNSHRSFIMDGDPNNREHNEVWPGSRTNHYWFDLNRDWMPVQHPESRGRIAQYQLWKPNVLTDHHEMGTQATYFFQPGVPSRDNPLTPQRTFELTGKLAGYHAEFLNEFGQLYWTEEVFDDYYLGKGSTYPDLQGSIGILFEQASSRGHLQESQHGDVKFPMTIRNQFVTSLSTLRGSLDLRLELLDHMRDFFVSALEEADASPVNAYVFGSRNDPARTWHLVDILRSHDIQIYRLNQAVEGEEKTFEPEWSFIIPAAQPQYRFLTGLFERRTEFQDSLFYDVSTWTLPFAFNLPFAELHGRDFRDNLVGDPADELLFPAGKLYGEESSYAYVFEWHGYYAPRALYRLLDAEVRVKVATRTFSAQTTEGLKSFDYGTIMINRGIQDKASEKEIFRILQTIAAEDAIEVYALETGLTPQGIDLGSQNFASLEKPEVMVLVGRGISMYEAGEIWHLLDQRYQMNLSLVETHIFNTLDLSRYNTIIMVNGNYNEISDTAVDNLDKWIRNGGTLITIRNASQWAVRNGLSHASFLQRPEGEFESEKMQPYINMGPTRGAQVIGGSIFQARLDLTHPLGYGFDRDLLPVFRNNTLILANPSNPWSAPLRYTDDPLLSGYVSGGNLEMLGSVPSIQVSTLGSGRVILMTDNPNFRAFWFGTNKLFANSLFFGRTINAQSGR